MTDDELMAIVYPPIEYDEVVELYRRVLSQAFLDALTKKRYVAGGNVARARAWVSLGNPGFIAVCGAAGINPSWAHEKFVKHENGVENVESFWG